MASSRSGSQSPRRAGSRGVPRAVREQQILDVAGRVFAQSGYHAASMDEIAAQADVTKPLVYAYFGSKEELYLAYIQRAGRELMVRMRGAAAPDAPPHDRLQAGVLEFLRFVDERRDGWQVLHAEAAARGGPLASEVATLRAAIARMIRGVLAESARGAEATSDAEVALDGVAHAFVGAGQALANWWLSQPQAAPERVADLLDAVARAGVEEALRRGGDAAS